MSDTKHPESYFLVGSIFGLVVALLIFYAATISTNASLVVLDMNEREVINACRKHRSPSVFVVGELIDADPHNPEIGSHLQNHLGSVTVSSYRNSAGAAVAKDKISKLLGW